MTEIGIIGDIHGHVDPLRRLVTKVTGKVETLVFVGDYVNRGLRSRQVIEFLLALPRPGLGCVFLAGNHDRAFLAALDGEFDAFLLMGGAATVRSYINPPYIDVSSEFVAAVPLSHRSFLSNLADEFTTDYLRVSHRRMREDIDSRFNVGGHTPQHAAIPVIDSTGAYVDTGCGTVPDGTLTCLFWPSLDWISEGGD